ncbi:MAG: hypothetical protein BWY06_02842 [Candidatus Latescibacteria bacterium ADurb.Bin168]|nr:MAG: hypothetical protein BWY06_02842 [Candidatus Latescibacteria bacterium ADurb.Bin168]
MICRQRAVPHGPAVLLGVSHGIAECNIALVCVARPVSHQFDGHTISLGLGRNPGELLRLCSRFFEYPPELRRRACLQLGNARPVPFHLALVSDRTIFQVLNLPFEAVEILDETQRYGPVFRGAEVHVRPHRLGRWGQVRALRRRADRREIQFREAGDDIRQPVRFLPQRIKLESQVFHALPRNRGEVGASSPVHEAETALVVQHPVPRGTEAFAIRNNPLEVVHQCYGILWPRPVDDRCDAAVENLLFVSEAQTRVRTISFLLLPFKRRPFLGDGLRDFLLRLEHRQVSVVRDRIQGETVQRPRYGGKSFARHVKPRQMRRSE